MISPGHDASSRTPIGPVSVLIAILGLAFAPQCFLFGATDWEKVYIPAAERLRSGESIYQDAFVYPPFAAMIALPATALPESLWPSHFWSMNVFGGIGLLLVGWRFTGGRFAWFPPRRECWITLLGLAASIGFVFDVLVNRQIDLAIAGAILTGCWCLVNRREYAGATLIGLATAAKFTPLLFVPYLIWVGRWRAGLVVLLVAFGANLLPDLLFPPADGQIRLQVWVDRVIAPTLGRDQNPGQWHAAIGFNHSLSGWVTRHGTSELILHDGKWDSRERANPPAPAALKVLVAGVSLGLLAVAAWATGRTRGVTPLGVGMTLCLMVLLSPMSSKPHFCVLVIPAWALARTAFERRRGWLVASSMAAGLGLLPNKDLLGGFAYDWVLWYGVIPLEVSVLFGGCAWAARRGAVTPPPAAS